RGLPRIVETFSSWFVPQVTDLDPNAALLFPLMRLAGVHVQIGYPCIFTTAHTQDDADKVVTAFEQSVDALRAVGILGGNPVLGAEIQPAATAQIGLPLTAAQREIWMTTQLGKQASCCFNESVSLELSGPLNLPALQRAMDQIIARHDGLRMVFARNGESFDVVDPYPLPLELHDVSTSDDPASALHHLLLDDAATP
ncbi:condensation domain-containing protein, partial [Falsihalocynthiibacter sp. BN13B15]|uniref:condensation domain-containing protein n=1 Tax=Falsihalocynthiibacter sp. BN13B15 TaxID=3240871 RepID=UPI0035105FAC